MKLSFEDAIAKIKMHLRDYMVSQGVHINNNGSFRCPNKSQHRHGDSKPSGYLYDNDSPRWQCLKCNVSGDTIDFAAFVNGLATEGPGFKYETLPHIIETLQLDIEIDYGTEEKPAIVELSKEVKKQFLSNPLDPKLLTDGTYGKTRKYPLDIAKKMVSLFNIAAFKEPIFDHPVFKPTLYPESSPLLVPITKNGFYLGAAGRHREVDVERGAPKYHNSEKTDIYNYPSIINYDRAQRACKREKRLYIFEGVFNAIAAVTYGIENAVGILGINSRFSDLEELVTHSSVREIVFCLDKDSFGADKAVQLGKLFHNMGYLCLYYKAQQNGLDYDEEFVQRGEALASEIKSDANLLSLLEFIVYTKADYFSRQDISKVTRFELFMEDVAQYGSIVSARNYAEALVDYYNKQGESVSFDDIYPRIRQSLLDRKSPLLGRIDEIVSTHNRLVHASQTVEEKISIVYKLGEAVSKVSEMVGAGLRVSGKRDLERLIADQEIFGARKYKTGYENIDNSDEQISRLELTQNSLCCLIGKPSHGKSLIVRGISMYQALNNPEALIIYFSTDDSSRRTFSWIVSSIAKVPFSEVIKPYKERDNQTNELVSSAYDRIRRMYGDSLLLYDKEQAATTSDQIRLVEDAVREFPNKRVLVFVDNLFNSNDISMIKNEGSKRYAIDSAVEQWKQCSMSKADIVLLTAEVKKNIVGRLTHSDIKETGSIEFRSDYIFSVFNSHKEWKGDSKMVTMINGAKTPIIELTVLKNKMGETSQDYFFHLDGPCGILNPVCDSQLIERYISLLSEDKGPRRQSSESGRSSGSSLQNSNLSAFRDNGSIW